MMQKNLHVQLSEGTLISFSFVITTALRESFITTLSSNDVCSNHKSSLESNLLKKFFSEILFLLGDFSA